MSAITKMRKKIDVSVTHIIRSIELRRLISGPIHMSWTEYFFHRIYVILWHRQWLDSSSGYTVEMENGVSPEHQDMFCSITRIPWAFSELPIVKAQVS